MISSVGQEPTFLLLATSDEQLSWRIEIWMKKNCKLQHGKPIPPPKKSLQGIDK